MNFVASFRAEFHDLVEQFSKGIPTFCIVKNIAYNTNSDVHLLTITLPIIVPMLSTSLQKKLKEVFNSHIKLACAITHKFNLILLFFIVLYYIRIDLF